MQFFFLDAPFQGKESSLIYILGFINRSMFNTQETLLQLREVDQEVKTKPAHSFTFQLLLPNIVQLRVSKDNAERIWFTFVCVCVECVLWNTLISLITGWKIWSQTYYSKTRVVIFDWIFRWREVALGGVSCVWDKSTNVMIFKQY